MTPPIRKVQILRVHPKIYLSLKTDIIDSFRGKVFMNQDRFPGFGRASLTGQAIDFL
jgi:hypothetical protein